MACSVWICPNGSKLRSSCRRNKRMVRQEERKPFPGFPFLGSKERWQQGVKQAQTHIFTCFSHKLTNLFRSNLLLCYTANARKKQAKKQKQAKKHDYHGDHSSFS